jgi:tetratricopeptide (TPR) repeat protein
VLGVAGFLALRTAVVGGLLPAGTDLAAGPGGSPPLRAAAALVHYGGKLVFPWPLSFVHELPNLAGVGDALASPGAWVLAAWAAGGAWSLRRARGRTVALSLALFLVPLAPPLVAAVAMYPPLADRYLYLPLFGFAVLCGRLGASALAGRAAVSPLGRILVAAGILAVGAATALRTADFGGNLTLWSDTVAKVPASSLARGQLATALFAEGRYEAGAEEAREAIRLDPANPDHHYNLALASERARVLDVAADEYRSAIALGNDDAEAHVHLASVLLTLGDARGAAVHASAAVGRDSSNAEAHYVLGRALVNQGDYAAGAEELAHAARLRPDADSWRRDAELAAEMAARTAVP